MNKQAQEEEHRRIREEVLQEPPKPPMRPRTKTAILYLIGAAILVSLTLWALPPDALPVRAQQGKIPPLEEFQSGIDQGPDIQSDNMEAYVLPNTRAVKHVAATVVTQACSRTDQACYADALFYFVRDNIKYVTDPVDEYYETPHETLRTGAADCDGHAILLSSLMRSVGILTRFHHEPRHVTVEAWLPQDHLFRSEYAYEWVHYDPTCTSCEPGERMPNARRS
ncbi:MAG: transglutaminase-like domain-containing protein [Candidatus Woesearchaeota archaeon]